MRHHLKDCLEAEKDTQPADTDWETDTVRMAREQATEKAQSVLSSLASKGRLRNGEQADVDVQVKLSCPECSVRVPFADAVERGYVCETHFDAESDESVREKGRNALSLLAVPYGLLEGIQTAVLEDPYLVEAVATAAIPV